MHFEKLGPKYLQSDSDDFPNTLFDFLFRLVEHLDFLYEFPLLTTSLVLDEVGRQDLFQLHDSQCGDVLL